FLWLELVDAHIAGDDFWIAILVRLAEQWQKRRILQEQPAPRLVARGRFVEIAQRIGRRDRVQGDDVRLAHQLFASVAKEPVPERLRPDAAVEQLDDFLARLFVGRLPE